LIKCQARRDDAAAEIDGDNRFAAFAAHLRPEPVEAKDGERVHRNQPLMRYALDRDIDQPADNDREHHQQRHPRAQMQFAEAGRHQLSEEDRQQH
jgi:hypothetical protein